MLRKDTLKYKGKRQQLAKLVEEKGIKDEKVLEAIKTIPRHLFMDSSFEEKLDQFIEVYEYATALTTRSQQNGIVLSKFKFD